MRKCISFMAVLLVLLSCLGSAGFCARAEGINSVSAVSAILYEPQSGRILYEKDAHTPRSMASTTKLMTALVAMECCSPDQLITVKPEAVRVEGSALGLRAGDQITMKDLVTGMLLVSGNDAANTVAYAVAGSIEAFADKMNQRAATLGMKNSHFVTPSGLDAEGHASSAYDMALLGSAVLRNDVLAEICALKSTVIRFGNPMRDVYCSNHNRLLQLYSYSVGMKTGFTKKSGRCLVSAAQKDGVQLIAVTLNAGDDWNDHMTLYNYGFSQLESVTLAAPELPLVLVSGGNYDHVSLRMDDPPICTLLKGEPSKVTVRYQLPSFVLAPVCTGQYIGSVQYVLGDRVLCTMNLTALDDVDARPVAGYSGRLWRYWKMLLHAFFG